MTQNKLPEWSVYWSRYNDADLLQKMSSDMDDTLRRIEAEFNCKLLSGDHLMIIDALEERIEELENARRTNPVDVQGELF
ncbi:hypothetical protein JW992_06705 [candidate division KSB1 bacterium]|nr:hypothetical protein [candidate division KSB1 bacterium]